MTVITLESDNGHSPPISVSAMVVPFQNYENLLTTPSIWG